MNDAEIRQNFHKKRLRWQHTRIDTLVIDELGLNHGKCRADIAVVNGHFIGYEIKSDEDSLRRLEEQVKSYNAVFDKAFIIVGQRHASSIQGHIPDWWGVILSARSRKGTVNFHTVRKAKTNQNTAPISVARLLWRNEAAEILEQKGTAPRILRRPRAVLYECLVDVLSNRELRRTVREHLKKRRNWRGPGSPSQYGGLCRPASTS